eukprot:g3517.t1
MKRTRAVDTAAAATARAAGALSSTQKIGVALSDCYDQTTKSVHTYNPAQCRRLYAFRWAEKLLLAKGKEGLGPVTVMLEREKRRHGQKMTTGSDGQQPNRKELKAMTLLLACF